MRLITGLLIAGALALLSSAHAQDVVRLWPDGAPGSQARRHEPEQAQDWWVKNIHDPSLTVFRPEAAANSGTAVIVIPGGGHRLVVFPPEGINPGRFLQEKGVTAFALKYRLANEEGSPYTVERDAVADARRAVRWVRAHAAEYGIDPNRIGVMGFSAGGELADLLALSPQDGNADSSDPIERVSSRPDFLISIYPGPYGIPATLEAAPPPAFLLTAFDDRMAMTTTRRILDLYGNWPTVRLQYHVLSGDGHGFNMGERSTLRSVHDWPQRLSDWLIDMGYTKAD